MRDFRKSSREDSRFYKRKLYTQPDTSSFGMLSAPLADDGAILKKSLSLVCGLSSGEGQVRGR